MFKHYIYMALIIGAGIVAARLVSKFLPTTAATPTA